MQVHEFARMTLTRKSGCGMSGTCLVTVLQDLMIDDQNGVYKSIDLGQQGITLHQGCLEMAAQHGTNQLVRRSSISREIAAAD